MSSRLRTKSPRHSILEHGDPYCYTAGEKKNHLQRKIQNAQDFHDLKSDDHEKVFVDFWH